MPSTYSSNLRLELIASGEQGNTWGNTTNNNLGSLLEQAITGITQITSLPVTLTALNGAADQSRALFLKVTAPLLADGVITAPATSKMYIVKNQTTGGFNITIKTSTSTGLVIPNGQTKIVYYDNIEGNFVEALNSAVAMYLSGNILTDTQATTKKYVDDQDYLLLPRDGSRNMTGDYLPLKNSTLIAGAPATSATPKGYVDGLQVTAGTGLTGGGTFAANSGNIPLSLNIGTASVLGGVKPNATQFSVAVDGTLSVNAASTSVLGCVKVDGSTITINGSGVISAAGTATGVTSLATTVGSGVLVNGGTGPASAAVTVSADTSVLATKSYVTSQSYVTSSSLSSTLSSYATTSYVNSTVGSYLPLSGGTVTGALTVNSTSGVKITSSSSPTKSLFSGVLYFSALSNYYPALNAIDTGSSTYPDLGFAQTNNSGTPRPCMYFGVNGDANIIYNLVVGGTISTGGPKPFRIDHPILEGKKLYHIAVEAPRADLIYRGEVKLVNGTASVDIDAESRMTEGTFAALTQNVEIVSLYNKDGFTRVRGSTVTGNSFTITAEDPTCTDTITWVVMAERNDKNMHSCYLSDENGRVIPEQTESNP